MIRMGRGSRSEQTNEPNNYESHISDPDPNPNPIYQQYTGDNPATSKAVTDSESMARDIKEGRLSGFVGHGTMLTGETAFEAMLRVDGHLVGTVSSEAGTLIIGTNGRVDANVNVSAAVINGTVNGDIAASEKIQLGRTARVIGNIQTPRLTIEDGAVLEGGCTMLKAREVVEKKVADQTESQYKASEIASYEADDADEDDAEGLLLSSETEDEDESEDKSEVATV